jgi:rhodanese-related sulfurtransferase
MEIGLFQLENLMRTNVQFCFLDISSAAAAAEIPTPLAAIVSRAVKIEAAKVQTYLKEKSPSKEAPVILLSEDGRSAKALAATLESANYTNIYVVEGGVAGLASEL